MKITKAKPVKKSPLGKPKDPTKGAAKMPKAKPRSLGLGKVVIDVDLGAVIAAHRQSGALATMVVRADPAAARWGAISPYLDPDGGGDSDATPRHDIHHLAARETRLVHE